MSQTTDQFEVALTGRLRHGALWKLAQRLGSQVEAARQVGIHFGEYNAWLNLRAVPNLKNERQFAAAVKIAELTNQSVDELWPEEIRRDDWLKAPKDFAKLTYVERGLLLDWKARNMSLPAPDASLHQQELQDTLTGALKKLSYRERQVVQMRWGLGGGQPVSTDDTAKHFRVSRSRIHQIEHTAMRKLKQKLGDVGMELLIDK